MRFKNFPYKSVLVVCSVNTARSPMAVGYLKYFFDKNKIEASVNSGGISSHARDGMLISLDAKLAMEEEGISLPDKYVSIDLKKHTELINNADLILTLTSKHKNEILQYINGSQKDVFTLSEFAGELGDIADPSMKGLEGFRQARDQIKSFLLKGIIKRCEENA
jgi:protein-tyrosine-phosphatase